MKNPLSALPMFSPDVPSGTFSRNFMKGASTGALMMGIFGALNVGLMAVGILTTGPAGLAAAALHLLPGLAVGTVATGLFTGITATQRAAESARSAGNVSHEVARRAVPARATEQAVAPAMEQAANNSRVWQDTVNASRSSTQDRVSQILADRSLNDSARASAILREREQPSALESQR